MLAGLEQGSYVDSFGKPWGPDRFFSAGWIFHDSNHAVAGTRGWFLTLIP